MVDLPGVLADGPLASESLALAVSTNIVEGFALGDSATYTLFPGGNINDGPLLGDVVTVIARKNTALTQSFKIVDQFTIGHPVAVIESFDVTDAFKAHYNLLISERVSISELRTVAASYHLTITDLATLAQIVDPINNAQIQETMGLVDVETYRFLGASAIQDVFNLHDGLSGHLIMRVVINEGIGLEDDEVLRMMYNETITEGFFAELAYQEPSGAITAWAINTRTNAVTQYTNFAFNSFASVGRKYIAASQSGLYELNGPTDTLNQAVIATMAGGFFQPNGTKLAGLKGVYLGVGGQGPGGRASWLLKIITDDNCERVYRAITGVGLRNTKFEMGKGLRSRYFAWEAINEQGQDFNLESVEFVPMMSGRRVGS